MFFVFNKEKVCAYIISVVTVCCLFFIANEATNNTIETSINTTKNEKNLNIEEENNVVKYGK